MHFLANGVVFFPFIFRNLDTNHPIFEQMAKPQCEAAFVNAGHASAEEIINPAPPLDSTVKQQPPQPPQMQEPQQQLTRQQQASTQAAFASTDKGLMPPVKPATRSLGQSFASRLREGAKRITRSKTIRSGASTVKGALGKTRRLVGLGSGIPSEHAKRLLDKFMTAESDADRAAVVVHLLKNVRKPLNRKDNITALREALLHIWRVLVRFLDKIDLKYCELVRAWPGV